MQKHWQGHSSAMENGQTFAHFQQPTPPPCFTSERAPQPSPRVWSVPSLMPLPSNEPGSATSLDRPCPPSAVSYPGDGGSFEEVKCLPECAGQSGPVLKEHDYIGLAEITSVSASQAGEEEGPSKCLHLKETDLRLALGPVTVSDDPPKEKPQTQGIEASKQVRVEAKGVDAWSETTWTGISHAARISQEAPMSESLSADFQHEKQVSSDLQPRNGGQDSSYPFSDSCPDHGTLQYTWRASSVSSRECAASRVSIPGQDFEGQRPAVPSANLASTFVAPPPKNGVKRGYAEAMAERGRFGVSESRHGANGSSATVLKSGFELQESELKAFQKHQQLSCLSNWPTSKGVGLPHWYSSLEHTSNSQPTSMTGVRASNQEPASNESPPQKGQVVGWPPVRSYRKNTLASQSKSSGVEEDGQRSVVGQSVSPNFVKVNMDGITIGRKVDLNAHTGYEGLLLALEEMFQPSICGQGLPGREGLGPNVKNLRLLNGSDYVLTHEDNEGDWMLVGDVPWGMFVNTVRRLRIMRGSDATGLLPRGPEKRKGHF